MYVPVVFVSLHTMMLLQQLLLVHLCTKLCCLCWYIQVAAAVAGSHIYFLFCPCLYMQGCRCNSSCCFTCLRSCCIHGVLSGRVVFVNVGIFVCMYVCVYACMYVCVCMFACTYVCMRVFTYRQLAIRSSPSPFALVGFLCYSKPFHRNWANFSRLMRTKI
jgi:hypothetical protein